MNLSNYKNDVNWEKRSSDLYFENGKWYFDSHNGAVKNLVHDSPEAEDKSNKDYFDKYIAPHARAFPG